MAVLSVNVRLAERGGLVRTLQMAPAMPVHEALRQIRAQLPEAREAEGDFGLYLADPRDPSKGIWMEDGRTLAYYMVRSGDIVEYRRKAGGGGGTTFFPVKEKMKGKNKLLPRTLGINKDSVMRVDSKTAEVIRMWPLEQVRRWAASKNTFTLDFGDYEDGYYCVQTPDGEKIAKLLAGYVDDLLRKRRANDHFGDQGDEGTTMLEAIVEPAKATLLSNAEITPAGEKERSRTPYFEDERWERQKTPITYGAVQGRFASVEPPPGRQPAITESDAAGRSQRALVGTIEASVKVVEKAEKVLAEPKQMPPMSDSLSRDTVRVNRGYVSEKLGDVAAATAEIIQLTAPVDDHLDHASIGAAVQRISSHIPDMTENVRTVAALMPQVEKRPSDDLITAARKTCGAMSDFLNSINPLHDERRQTVLAAAGRVGDYSQNVKANLQSSHPLPIQTSIQDQLVEQAKAVATATAQLVLKAKHVSTECPDEGLRVEVIKSATKCAFATSQLVATARVVAPSIQSLECQQQLVEAARLVAQAVERLLTDAESAASASGGRGIGDLRAAAAAVTTALNRLLCQFEAGQGPPPMPQPIDRDSLFKAAKRLATATSDMLTNVNTRSKAKSLPAPPQPISAPPPPPRKPMTPTVEYAPPRPPPPQGGRVVRNEETTTIRNYDGVTTTTRNNMQSQVMTEQRAPPPPPPPPAGRVVREETTTTTTTNPDGSSTTRNKTTTQTLTEEELLVVDQHDRVEVPPKSAIPLPPPPPSK